jgi:hypothetical protein
MSDGLSPRDRQAGAILAACVARYGIPAEHHYAELIDQSISLAEALIERCAARPYPPKDRQQ